MPPPPPDRPFGVGSCTAPAPVHPTPTHTPPVQPPNPLTGPLTQAGKAKEGRTHSTKDDSSGKKGGGGCLSPAPSRKPLLGMRTCLAQKVGAGGGGGWRGGGHHYSRGRGNDRAGHPSDNSALPRLGLGTLGNCRYTSPERGSRELPRHEAPKNVRFLPPPGGKSA